MFHSNALHPHSPSKLCICCCTPAGEDINEWLAVNTVFFYNALNVLYQVLDETLCTAQRCPTMSAGPQVW